MSTGVVTAIVVAVLIVIAIAATMATTRTTPAGTLKHRFGPEYDRTLAQHSGDAKATRKELSERVKRYGRLERGALSEQARTQYADRWTAVQAQFVEDPARSVHEADRLIADLAQDRGFPAAGSPEHFDALSVHHAHQVQGYRQAHALAEHAGAGGRRATEDLRQALVSARELFNDLLTTEPKSASSRTRAAEPEPAPEPEAGSEPAAAEQQDPVAAADEPEHPTLGHRFAALTGSVRKSRDDDAEQR